VNGAAIRLDGVSVRFQLPHERRDTLKEQAIAWLRGQRGMMEVRALDDVDLEVRRGEVFGVVGHNGAGKSTLLRLVAQVLRPTRGRVRVRGRLAPLLDLGTGFHPELTGRENVVMAGTMLGFSRLEMERRMDRIVAFSGLGAFIDTPARAYSTGMWSRLGFAIATDARPDILVVDEAISVGDAAFQSRCERRIAELVAGGATALIVSHDPNLVATVCHRAVLLERGRVAALGTPAAVLAAYRDSAPREACGAPVLSLSE